MSTTIKTSFRWMVLLSLALATGLAGAADQVLRVGSKRFAESSIPGEVLTQTALGHGKAEHRQGLGNTAIVLAALQAGSIDVYPEYLGTIDLEILNNLGPTSLAQVRAALALTAGPAWPSAMD